MKKKIVFFELENWEKKFFTKILGDKHELIFIKEPLTNEVPKSAQNADIIAVFIYSHISKKVLDQCKNVKLITTLSTGFDHIDVDECKKRGIEVTNVPTYGENTVAEHTFALILACSKRIIESYKRVKEGWFSPEGLTTFDIRGKTLGVIGVGNIGQNVIRIANGFEMNVLGYKRTKDEKLEKELGFKIVELDELMKKSDIITLHVPYTKETHHLIGQKEFEMMKKGVIIINTSRGAVIDTNALLKNLDNKKIKAAGLDVCEGEPILREETQLVSRQFEKEELLCVLESHMLQHYDNVVMTPHNAFNSKEALLRILETTAHNITSFEEENVQNSVFKSS